MRLVTAHVVEALPTQHGVQHLSIEYIGLDGARCVGKALRYQELAAACEAGDRVLVNTTAVDLMLGTGGSSMVLANLSAIARSEAAQAGAAADIAAAAEPGTVEKGVGAAKVAGTPATGGAGAGATAQAGATVLDDLVPGRGHTVLDDVVLGRGHIMKLRYTPLQHQVLSVEEPDSPFHEIIKNTTSLKGTPVICCELHSQIPLAAAAAKHVMPEARIVYCMTDEAALLASFSTLLVLMRQSGLLAASISCGQAFGGDYEAVNTYSGLLAASVVCKADIIICAQGPGIVGTATRFGHGGMAQAEALHAASVLDGVPIAMPRISFADARQRHQGVSHHSLTALGRACLIQAIVPLPKKLPKEQAKIIEKQLEQAGILERHGLVHVDFNEREIDLKGIEVHTMGRSQADDPAFFSVAFAAGIFAARLLQERL